MTQTRAIGAAADVICRAMQQGRSVPATVAYALDAAGMLQSPESAAELARLRARSADLEAGLPVMQTALFRALDRVAELESERHATNDALVEVTVALRSAEAERDALRAQLETPPVAVPLPPRGARCACGHSGADHHHAGTACWGELSRLRAADGTLGPVRVCDCQAFEAVAPEPASESARRLRGLLARQRAAVEDPHDSPLHHSYAVPRDLPEVSS